MKYKTFEKFQILVWILFAIYCVAFTVFVVCEIFELLDVTSVDTGEVFVAPNNLFFNSIPVCFFILLLLFKYVNWLEHYQYRNGYYLWLSYSDCLKLSMISKKIVLEDKHYVYTKISSNPFFSNQDYVILFSFSDWIRFRFDALLDNWRKNIKHTDEISRRDKETLIAFLEDMQSEIDKVKEQAAKEFETGKEIFEKVLDKS